MPMGDKHGWNSEFHRFAARMYHVVEVEHLAACLLFHDDLHSDVDVDCCPQAL